MTDVTKNNNIRPMGWE